MEAYFGGGLFHPGPGMRPTARGELVAHGVSKILSDLRSTRALCQQRIVRIGFIRVVRPLVERVLRELGASRSAGFDVELFELPSEAQARKLNVRELDVAICYSRGAQLAWPDTIERLFITAQPYSLVMPEHAWKRGSVDWRALSRLHYTYLPRASSPQVFASGKRWLRTHSLEPVRQIECTLATEVIAYAGAGRGYGFLPALWSTTNREGVVFAPAADFSATSEVAAFWHAGLELTLSPFLTRLEKIAREVLRDDQPTTPTRIEAAEAGQRGLTQLLQLSPSPVRRLGD